MNTTCLISFSLTLHPCVVVVLFNFYLSDLNFLFVKLVEMHLITCLLSYSKGIHTTMKLYRLYQ